MLEQLFNLIKTNSQNEIIDNPAIPNEQNNHAVGLAADSVFNGLQGALANGGLKSVLGMFTGNGDTNGSNPIVGNIIHSLTGSLASKFGIDENQASGIASSLIPSILSKMANKTNDPNDSSFDINGIMGSLTGGNSSQGSPVEIPGMDQNLSGGIDFGGILKNLSGGVLDNNHDGSLGLDDLAGLIGKAKGGAQQGQQSSSQGGVMDMLKGFMN
ncbi:hypothetical protein EMGBS15_18290 [Filimonas sp.]|nr:hypothetical protein EMGBS15_18290 [Filimonas sp.]